MQKYLTLKSFYLHKTSKEALHLWHKNATGNPAVRSQSKQQIIDSGMRHVTSDYTYLPPIDYEKLLANVELVKEVAASLKK